MLDPRTIRALAARPEQNGRDLDVALAEEGDAHALASLLRWSGLEPEALTAITERVLGRGAPIEPGGPDEDPPRIDIPWEPADEARVHRPWSLDRALLSLVVMHPRAPSAALEAIVARHPDEPGFLIGAALSPQAPRTLVERLAATPARSTLHDRSWIDLLAARLDVPQLVQAWSASDDELLREAAARLSDDSTVLARLAHDRARRVRRAVAHSPSINAPRDELARDPAVEVRGAAHAPPQPRSSTQAAHALARAARVFERGGDLDPRTVDAIIESAGDLDPELAWLAGLVLDLDDLRPVALALAEHDAGHPSSRAMLAAAMLRPTEATSAAAEASARADLANMLARAIARSYVPSSEGAKGLTGYARLVAFLSELLADPQLVDEGTLVMGLSHGAIASDPALAARFLPQREARSPGMTRRLAAGLVVAAARGGRPPACALEAAWRDTSIELPELVRLARVVKPRREAAAHLRGRADGAKHAHVDLDLDPALRPGAELVAVTEALDPWIRVSMRVALVVLAATPRALAVGGREVRQWVANTSGEHPTAGAADGVVSSQMQRILRAARGAGRVSGDETRVAKLDVHADEAGVAVALLAQTTKAQEVADLLGRAQRLKDGMFIAAIIEALWGLGRRDDVKVLVDAVARLRRQDAALLVAWLVVGELDRNRTTSVLAGALDEAVASTPQGPLPTICQALGVVERRVPGTLERLRASTRAGQASVVNALARAYPGLVGSR
jgi:hypothetical protein